ncbi:dynein heavy chain and region D6 of dynein motor-domain-containing protein [Phakopsora pachyrhizi]|nr:dynein heavy chain and region D6 of dynein motor-domain-containing protein [Phakopsora pachyrhizi]
MQKQSLYAQFHAFFKERLQYCPLKWSKIDNYHHVQPLDEKEGILIADGSRLEDFVLWAQALPKREQLHWLSLLPNAKALVAAAQGAELLTRLLKMCRTDKDEMVGKAIKQSKASEASRQPKWMRTLATTAFKFLKSLSTDLLSLDPAQNNIKGPLIRFFNQEVQLGQKLLRIIKKDLQYLVGVCSGEIKPTNHLRDFINKVTKEHLDGTATRQLVSHQTNILLEELELQIFIDDSKAEANMGETNAFRIEGLVIQGGCNEEFKASIICWFELQIIKFDPMLEKRSENF